MTELEPPAPKPYEQQNHIDGLKLNSEQASFVINTLEREGLEIEVFRQYTPEEGDALWLSNTLVGRAKLRTGIKGQISSLYMKGNGCGSWSIYDGQTTLNSVVAGEIVSKLNAYEILNSNHLVGVLGLSPIRWKESKEETYITLFILTVNPSIVVLKDSVALPEKPTEFYLHTNNLNKHANSHNAMDLELAMRSIDKLVPRLQLPEQE